MHRYSKTYKIIGGKRVVLEKGIVYDNALLGEWAD